MNSKIFVLNANKTLTPLEEGPFESEDIFQELLELHPDLLVGDQMNPSAPRRWLIVSREYGVPRAENEGDWWSLDHLFIDHEAIPTLVEVKRASDTRARREVVAQMLDYAANGVAYWPVDGMRERFGLGCASRQQNPARLIGELLEITDAQEADIEAFWEKVKTNLQAGRIRMVFVADRISVELQRIVEFLNKQMDPAEVLAIEIRHYAGGDLRTLVPTVIGRSQLGKEPPTPRANSRRYWNESSFFEAVGERLGLEPRRVLRGVYDFMRGVATKVDFGTGLAGSFSPKFASYHPTVGPLTVNGDGTLSVRCTWLRDDPEAFNMGLRFGERLSQIPGFELPSQYRETDVWIPFDAWAPHVDAIQQIVEEVFVSSR